jgi:hypothetical protein
MTKREIETGDRDREGCHCEEPAFGDEAIPDSIQVRDCFARKGGSLAMTDCCWRPVTIER